MSSPTINSAYDTSLQRTIFLTMIVAAAVVGLLQQLVDDFLHPTTSPTTQVEVIDWITVAPNGDYTLTQIATPSTKLQAELARLESLPETIHAAIGDDTTTTLTVHQAVETGLYYCFLPGDDHDDIDWLGVEDTN